MYSIDGILYIDSSVDEMQNFGNFCDRLIGSDVQLSEDVTSLFPFRIVN